MPNYDFIAPAPLADIPHITVVDAPCGAGKTTWAIEEMDRNPHQRYIFCTPFLEELKRIIRDSKVHCFVQPLNFEKSKLEHFEELLAQKRGMVRRNTWTELLPLALAHKNRISTTKVTVFRPPAVEPELPPMSISTTDTALPASVSSA